MTRNRIKRVTILEVAQESGVSYQTVSRVINEHPNVAPETRSRILDVIKRFNYRPSKAARSLASKYSSTLAVITYGMEFYGLTQMVVNIERYARKAGYDIVFSNVDLADDWLSRSEAFSKFSKAKSVLPFCICTLPNKFKYL